jgi:SRSO17 transposase
VSILETVKRYTEISRQIRELEDEKALLRALLLENTGRHGQYTVTATAPSRLVFTPAIETHPTWDEVRSRKVDPKKFRELVASGRYTLEELEQLVEELPGPVRLTVTEDE